VPWLSLTGGNHTRDFFKPWRKGALVEVKLDKKQGGGGSDDGGGGGGDDDDDVLMASPTCGNHTR
jgi:hypothetical protein